MTSGRDACSFSRAVRHTDPARRLDTGRWKSVGFAVAALLLLAACEEPTDDTAAETAADPPPAATATPTATTTPGTAAESADAPTAAATPAAAATASPRRAATEGPRYTDNWEVVFLHETVIRTDGGVKHRSDCDDGAATGDPGWADGLPVLVVGRGTGDCAGWYRVILRNDESDYDNWVRAEYLANPDPAPVVTPQPLDAEASRAAFEKCLNPWDGNLDALEDLVRPLLLSPDSMRTHETRYRTAPVNSPGDGAHGAHYVTLTYSADNAFGVRLRATATAYVHPSGCRIVEWTSGLE